MTQIDGLPFTQLTNLNITGELYEHGEPFGGVAAPLTLSTANDPSERPLKLRGGADVGAENYDSVNSGLIFTDGSDNEIWRLWGSNPTENVANGANLFLGFEAGAAQPTATDLIDAGQSNTGIGWGALTANTEGGDNTALGTHALESLTLGGSNTALGSHALSQVILGGNNTGVGTNALEEATGSNNTAVGNACLNSLTSGNSNTAVGVSALGGVTTAGQNAAFGLGALQQNTGADNVAVGFHAIQDMTAGANNVGLGAFALSDTSTPGDCIAIGFQAAQLVEDATQYIAIGTQTLQNAAAGTGNIAIGHQAGLNLGMSGISADSAQNIIIGAGAAATAPIAADNVRHPTTDMRK